MNQRQFGSNVMLLVTKLLHQGCFRTGALLNGSSKSSQSNQIGNLNQQASTSDSILWNLSARI